MLRLEVRNLKTICTKSISKHVESSSEPKPARRNLRERTFRLPVYRSNPNTKERAPGLHGHADSSRKTQARRAAATKQLFANG